VGILYKGEKNMTNQYMQWTSEELCFLSENYNKLEPKKLISELRNRSWKSIAKKANIIGAKKDPPRKAHIEILLEETPITYYWIGFLMADGSFSDRRIYLGVAKKDLEHLKKFQQYVNSTNKIQEISSSDHYRIKLTNVLVVKSLKEKFSIKSNKTKVPCSIKHIKNEDLLFSLIIGFIDGDGCVYKNKTCNSFSMSIVSDVSWHENIKLMETFLYRYCDEGFVKVQCKIRKHKTYLPQDKKKVKKEYDICKTQIGRRSLLEKIKKEAQRLKLPFMKRKLGKIKY